jgi:hypothetical protein
MACSFCNSYTHNINSCRDPEIDHLYQRMKNIYLDIAVRQNAFDEGIIFRTEIARLFNLRQVRGVAIKYAHTIVASKGVMIERIYNYFRRNIIIPQNGEQWLTRRIPLQDDILWYMDTTPDVPATQNMVQDIIQQLHFIGPYSQVMPLIPSLIPREMQPQPQIQLQPQKFDIVLILEDKQEEKEPKEEKEEKEEKKQIRECECSICYENIKTEDLIKLNCNHEFCGNCIKESLKLHNNIYVGPNCALCRETMTTFYVKKNDIYDSVAEHCKFREPKPFYGSLPSEPVRFSFMEEP